MKPAVPNVFARHNHIAGLVFLGVAVMAGLLLWAPGVFRNVRNEIIYRLPFAVPTLPKCPDCNIILVNLDTMRADEMPCYGYSRDTTPNLCAFAKKNILFSRFFTQTSFTLDSHMSIFTGLYPSTHHVTKAITDKLNPDIPTLTQVLQKNGYRTIWAGATDDVNLPLNKGFERGLTEIHDLDGTLPSWSNDYAKILSKLKDNTPTFIFFHSYAPHSPYLPGEKNWHFSVRRFPWIPVTLDEFQTNTFRFYEYVISNYRSRLTKSVTPESKIRNTRIVNELSAAVRSRDINAANDVMYTFPNYEQYDLRIGWYWKNIDETNPAIVSYIMDIYDETLYQIDQKVKDLLDFVEQPEIKRKTIVIIFSDNGEDFTEHSFFDHGWNIYNTATHAPFIMAAPRVRSGVFHQLIQAIDMYPTLLNLVGIRPIAPLEGQSIVPVLEGRGEQHIGERYLIGQHRGDNIVSIRNSRWKMYKNNTTEKHYVELYDLLTDPLEQHNILGKHLDIAGRLDTALIGILKGSPKYASVSGEFPAWMDEEKRKELIEEGYF